MSSEKHGELTARIRKDVVSGRFQPGRRLPARTRLAKRYDVSSVTLQRAIDTLAEEGLLTGIPRQGTVVAEHPPHLHCYGLLYPWKPTPKKPWPRNWQAIDAAARELLDQRPNRLVNFYDSDIQQSLAEHQALLDEVAAHRLAGLIRPALPMQHMADLIASGGSAFPIVVWGNSPMSGLTVIRQKSSAAPRMLDYLAARGRRRVGQLVPGAWFESPHYEAEFLRPISARGMRCEPRWIQVVLPHVPQGARNVAELLAGIPDGPDAIILHDDNAVQEAIDGIRAAGKRIPEDIELVVWGNFPWPESYTAPVKRFGVDMLQLVSRAKEYIDARRRGESPEPVIEMDVIDEDEAKQRSESFSGQRVLMPER
jgi:DNA-binding LacI/PurR family transcriptional regulator